LLKRRITRKEQQRKDQKMEQQEKLVFKRCGEWIVYLLKIEGKTLTNENRKSLKERTEEERIHAQYRGNMFFVVKIEHIWEKNEEGTPIKKDKIENTNYSKKFLSYVAGEIIEEKDYDKDIEMIRGRGIHYYLDEKTAKDYSDFPLYEWPKYSGEVRTYYDDGIRRTKYYCIDGEREGKCKKYYGNRNLHIKCFFVKGKEEGAFESYYISGELYGKYNFYNGELHGKYERFYKNGHLQAKSSYKHGEYDGGFVSYGVDEEVKMEYTYIDGVRTEN